MLSGFLVNRTVVTDIDLGDARRYLPFLSRWSTSERSETAIQGAWLQGWQPRSLGLGSGSLVDRQWLDIRNYSVPALCHYEDRMSMAASREIRLPFLDPRLMDLLMRAPDSFKLRNGWTKYAFRKAMEALLPHEISWRRDKKGFSNPEGEWLKHELRERSAGAFASDSLMCREGNHGQRSSVATIRAVSSPAKCGEGRSGIGRSSRRSHLSSGCVAMNVDRITAIPRHR